MHKNGKNTVLNAPEEKDVYPPTPAFTKAGAAPGVWSLFLLACHYLRQLRQCLKSSAAASTRHSGHCPLVVKGLQACCLPAVRPLPSVVRAFKPAVCQDQMPKMSRVSFHQALWPQACVVRPLKPAVCLHGALLLRRSSLPFAGPQMPKMPRGSFDQALCPHLLLEPCSLPFASMVLCC